jgi:hypothetical protein
MPYLSEGNVASIREWGNDESWSISQVLVPVHELSITNVSEAVPNIIVPTMTELTLPLEGLGCLHTHLD